jgi:flagellar hook assembly protein FlgD
MKLYDYLGKEVAVMLNDVYHNSGVYSVNWNGKYSDGADASSGIYFYTMTFNGLASVTKKMILIR